MDDTIVYTAGSNSALRFACMELTDKGYSIVNKPAPDAKYLLLPVPSFEADGRIRGGGILEHILADLPENVTVIGGNLDHPALQGYPTIDLLRDPYYIAQNAYITADCALRVAGRRLQTVFRGCPILVIGWGRIGKCLTEQLWALGADITVAARKESDRAILQALGYQAIDPQRLNETLGKYRVIFNTVPAPVLDDTQAHYCRNDCLKIELASTCGIAGANVIPARGLPGKEAPESSGKLIADTIVRILASKEAAP